jgi:hypothetical protein
MRWQLLGPRRALSLFILGFLTTLFVLVGLAQGGAWQRCFFALAGAYGIAFFALASEWFWARWYAMGLAGSGITLAILGMVTSGWNGALAIWGGIHLLIYAPLIGDAMAERYEGKTSWRERYRVDEYGVARLKRAVKGAATALPTLIFFSLAPRQGHDLALWALPALAALGICGLVRMRYWGVALLGVATVWTAVLSASALPAIATGTGAHVSLTAVALVALGALLLSISPFVVPTYRWLRRG